MKKMLACVVAMLAVGCGDPAVFDGIGVWENESGKMFTISEMEAGGMMEPYINVQGHYGGAAIVGVVPGEEMTFDCRSTATAYEIVARASVELDAWVGTIAINGGAPDTFVANRKFWMVEK